MMRFHTTSSLVFAGLLGIPALAARQDGSFASLEQALASTESAIAEIMGLREQLLHEKPEALDRIVEVTEGPLGPGVDTVNHIIVIQQQIDALQRSLTSTTAGTKPLEQVPSQIRGQARPRARIAPAPAPAPVNAPAQVHGLQRSTHSVALEDEGYSLDNVRRGKLLVRAGRSTEAIATLQESTTPEGRYWLARARQDIGDTDAALKIYDVLESDPDAGVYQAWAKQDRALIHLREQINKQESEGAQDQ